MAQLSHARSYATIFLVCTLTETLRYVADFEHLTYLFSCCQTSELGRE